MAHGGGRGRSRDKNNNGGNNGGKRNQSRDNNHQNNKFQTNNKNQGNQSRQNSNPRCSDSNPQNSWNNKSNNNGGNSKKTNNNNNRNVCLNYREGHHVSDLTQNGNLSPHALHLRLLHQADLLVDHHKRATQARIDGLRNGIEQNLWDLVGRFNCVDIGLCEFLHTTGIKDADGDTIMTDAPSMCACVWSLANIPDCFLRAFYYMVVVNQYRQGLVPSQCDQQQLKLLAQQQEQLQNLSFPFQMGQCGIQFQQQQRVSFANPMVDGGVL